MHGHGHQRQAPEAARTELPGFWATRCSCSARLALRAALRLRHPAPRQLSSSRVPSLVSVTSTAYHFQRGCHLVSRGCHFPVPLASASTPVHHHRQDSISRLTAQSGRSDVLLFHGISLLQTVMLSLDHFSPLSYMTSGPAPACLHVTEFAQKLHSPTETAVERQLEMNSEIVAHSRLSARSHLESSRRVTLWSGS